PLISVLSLLTSPPERAIALLYLLLAITFVLFTALTILSLQRVSAAWKALEEAGIQREKIPSTAWHNLSQVQHALETQLSTELQLLRNQIGPVAQEVEKLRGKVMRCEAECGKELEERVQALENQGSLRPLLQQLQELKQQQLEVAAAMAAVQNLSEIFCPSCPEGWLQFSRTCYYISYSPKSWQEANSSCASLRAHLAIVETEQENVSWGRAETAPKSQGVFSTQNKVSFSPCRFWNRGEPNNVGEGGEDCANIYSSGFWNDAPCSGHESWVCERSC
ncbi:C209A protein, partial [Galbula dea]|nr:C209A protein [Galbula dea]